MEMFFGAYILFGCLAILARYKSRLAYIVIKPIPLLILAGYLLVTPFHVSLVGLLPWVLFAAIIFGLLGDIFLLFEKYFLYGLIAFLLGHLAFLYIFIQSPLSFSYWIFVLLAIGISYGWLIVNHLIKDQRKKYIIPVIIYLTVIIAMIYSVLLMENGSKLYLVSGALAFGISDGILAFNKFIRPFKMAQFFILATYYSAQLFLCAGVIEYGI